MDINSLLSPQDSPAQTPPPPAAMPSPSLLHIQSPSKRAVRQPMPSRTPSGLSQQITSSPQQFHEPHPPNSTAHAQALYQHLVPAMASPGLAGYTNGRGAHSATSTPPLFDQRSPRDSRMTPPHPLGRQASGMDTLADLASMQHVQVQQAARQHQSVGQRPSISLQNIPRTISGGSDVSMAEPSPKPPRTFNSTALDPTTLETLNQYEQALANNPFDYYSHIGFITLLHQGLQAFLYPQDGPPPTTTYELLPALREEYEAMDSKYALGEQLWEYRLNDEKALARTIEERMNILELFQKATAEEPYSAKLWVMYGDYLTYLISCVWDPNAPEIWSEEEKTFGKELFTTDLLMDVWQRGADFVKSNVATSNLVWDRYLQLLQDDVERHYSPDKVRRVAAIFNDRLNQPHATWDDTLSMFSSFNSRYYKENYETIMEHAVSQNAHIKKTYALRQEFEFNLEKAAQAGDEQAEYYNMTRYLKWEKKTIGVSSFHIVNALYERATVRFPIDPALWEDHVEFLIWQNNRSVSLLDVIERATRHCPWSGSLWSHRILTLEADGKEYDEIERVKHTATNTGMLEHTDLEELIKLQIAWCGYLRRKAFDDPKSTEDDADIAEVGIRSALEHAHATGVKKHGKDWTGDPKYRLERIHIKFWTQRGNIQEATQIWDSLIPTQKDSYDFWYRYYIWEMVLWSNQAVRDKTNAGQPLLTPARATAVLEQGMKRLKTIDQPEALLDMYVNHCEQHESVLKVRSAFIEQRRSTVTISIRRQHEAAQATQQAEAAADDSKRKREDADDEITPAKRSKQSGTVPTVEAVRQPSEAPSTQSTTTQKRDREHTTVIVRNLPAGIGQTRLRQFFTDAGKVTSITIRKEQDFATATVEFENSEEADYALSLEPKAQRDLKHTQDGKAEPAEASWSGPASEAVARPITIRRGENTTVYVTNYPAHADETLIRNLFCRYGEITSVRFPSLKFDVHRRFCYVQFASSDEALAATGLDGHEVEGLNLLVKLSDPHAKKKRVGATEEGREVYAYHLPFSMKNEDVRELFAEYGAIESIRLPTHPVGKYKGNNKGYVHVTYEHKEDAAKAAQELNGKRVWGLSISAQVAKPKGELGPKIRSAVVRDSATPGPEDDDAGIPKQNGDATADASGPAPVALRSIALLNVPDTVNDARIAALLASFDYKKITLMPQHAGAIIEFHDVASVGKASLALDGVEIAPGRNVTIGTVAELKQSKAEYRGDKLVSSKPAGNAKKVEKKEGDETAKPAYLQPTRVNRPTARGASSLRARGKPGLGHRPAARPTQDNAGEQAPVKSNAAFREMLLGKKTEDKPATNGEDAEMAE